MFCRLQTGKLTCLLFVYSRLCFFQFFRLITNSKNVHFYYREIETGKSPSSGAAGGDHRVLTSTPSQKQSRLQLDKRYLSIRKTIFSKSDSSSNGGDKLQNPLFDGPEAENSLTTAMTSSAISPEHQRMLLLKVWSNA